MGIDITRLQQKKADGSYDVVHPETQAKGVWMSDGRSVEEALGEGGGGGAFIVTADVDWTSSGSLTISNVSHTYAEILEAYEAGKDVCLKTATYNTNGSMLSRDIFPLLAFVPHGEIAYAMFSAISGFTSLGILIMSDGTAYVVRTALASIDSELGGTLIAGANHQNPSTSLLRNTKLVSTDTTPTVEGEINWTYG